MPHLFVRHTVEDFDVWKLAYEADRGAQHSSYGISEIGLHRGADNPNDITAVFEVESIARAQEYVGSDQLKEAMMQAGVQGMPEIWFTD